MTSRQEAILNDFFVHVFNKILAWEEQALARVGAQDLSVKELHVLEAVHRLSLQERSTMTCVAEELSIHVSSLTAAVNTLVRKGYLRREAVPRARPAIPNQRSQPGEPAHPRHTQFHARMIRSAGAQLSDQEWEVLTQSLSRLNAFFAEVIQTGGGEEDTPART